MSLKPFCKLADPDLYVACPWDLSADAEAREYWANYFIGHAPRILAPGIEAEVARRKPRSEVEARALRAREILTARLREFQRSPNRHGRVTLLTFDAWRDGCFREHGFADCFIDRKHTE